MIHYHGTPVGGKREQSVRFLSGRHALVPFSYPDDIGVVAEVCQSFVLDNGAFSAWTKGKQMDVVGYAHFVADWHRHPGFDWALIPDVIDGSEEENDRQIEQWFDGGYSGVPVYHLHESIDRLARLANHHSVVAIGSSGQWRTPGTQPWWNRMNECVSAICDSHGRPVCKLHGLRMLDPEIFSRLPLSSADSTNASVNSGSLSRFGSYIPPSTGQRAEVIASRIEAFNSAPCWINQQERLFA